MRAVDPERWSVLSPLLDEVLELRGDERTAWLAALGARDPGLAADLHSLLEDHGALTREAFLERNGGLGARQASLEGLVIGAYRLRTRIGQGGMGGVWLADRCDGRFEGVAAVKLLNASLVGAQGEARFRREGSILARLRHPHIAHLIDAGVSVSGQPYLVLEHVDGDPIDVHCDAGRLGVTDRIRLFLDVLGAVAHAHASLIVHRDIKPQNVLVTKDGQVKLLDFGIARLVESEPGAGAMAGVTREGATALTLEYAAPEQLTGGDVTTATDVYALGVLLYELLTGRHPIGVLPPSPAELIRAIVEMDPVRASEAVSGRGLPSDDTAEAIAAHRGASPRRLEAALQGDLDNILNRAFRKSPSERYASVQAMAEDLRRHLAHEPVSARADTLGYRTAKFVRRNRGGVAAGLLVVAAVLSGTAGIAWQAREAQRQRDAARSQLARANATNEFMGFLLSVAAPPGQKFEVVELLETGEALVDKQFPESNPLRVEMLATIGHQYLMAERWDKARPVLEQAAELAVRFDDPALTARVQCPLALLHTAAGELDRGREMMTDALQGLPDEPQHALLRAECLIRFATFGFITNDAEETIRHASAAIELLDADPSLSPQQRVDAQSNLAYGYLLARENTKADQMFAEVFEALETSGRGRTVAAADALNNWALVHFLGNLGRAVQLMERCLELRRAIEGSGGVTPTVSFNLAGALLQQARYPEARDLLEKTILTAAQRQELRIELDAMLELAQLHLETGDLTRAAAQIEAVSARPELPRAGPGRQIGLLYQKGRLALAEGNAPLAREHLAEAVRRLEERSVKLAISVMALNYLAEAEQALGRPDQAMSAAEQAVSLAESFVEEGARSYLMGLSLGVRGQLELSAGRRDAANGSFHQALSHLEATLGPDHPATREVQILLVR